ncbi:hypothetical protein [Nonomuraea endophytica]|uniref:Outer membrane receptor protein involved in Fe transport n=1 Tax=Nonomuraea endophytica TaxID=714136 RepID=A0A7W8AAI3_9ACTN|nr:hypothetical protein [Nonomuraea endophytica]MBB5082084.1 outer membrane receptor protein involved in Fe transport [Nonomuraea endophytica]
MPMTNRRAAFAFAAGLCALAWLGSPGTAAATTTPTIVVTSPADTPVRARTLGTPVTVEPRRSGQHSVSVVSASDFSVTAPASRTGPGSEMLHGDPHVAVLGPTR